MPIKAEQAMRALRYRGDDWNQDDVLLREAMEFGAAAIADSARLQGEIAHLREALESAEGDVLQGRKDNARLSAELAAAKAETTQARVNTWLKSPAYTTYAELKHGIPSSILISLQEGVISRGKACEALAEWLHGKDPAFAAKDAYFDGDAIPSEQHLAATAQRDTATALLRELAAILNPHEAYDATKIAGWARDTVERAREADVSQVRAEAAEKELDPCRAECRDLFAKAGEMSDELASTQATLADVRKRHDIELLTADEYACRAARLRGALDGLIGWMEPQEAKAYEELARPDGKPRKYPITVTDQAIIAAVSALAEPPSASLAKVKAAALREAARDAFCTLSAKGKHASARRDGWEDGIRDCSLAIDAIADRLEREAGA